MAHYLSYSEKETKKLAQSLAKKISHGVIALSGELGSGKTTFMQGFAKGLGIKEKIISPTFILIRHHQIPMTGKILYHIDLYRLENNLDIKQIGLEEILSNPDNLVLIEWAEKVEKFLPSKTIRIFIEKLENNKRKITIE